MVQMKHARIIGFISVKGGVGKTTSVANLGFILANNFKKKVLVVDGNFSAPNLALHFGFVKPQYTLHDVLDGKVNIRKAIYEHSSGMHLLPSSLISKKVDYTKFGKHLAGLRSFYDVIINKVRGKKYELSLDEIQNTTKVPVVSVLHDDEGLLEALAKTKPLAALKENNTVIEYKKLAAALIGERYRDSRLTTKVKGLFSKKLSQDEVNRAIVMVSHY